MQRVLLLLVVVLLVPTVSRAQDCSVPAASRYPVAGPVNGGWDRTLEAMGAATYDCDGLYSNSDYVAGTGSRAHHGNDFFAAFQSPIVAVTDGVVAKAGWETGLGNRVAIHDACGWEYDSGHLDSIADGIAIGTVVHAGDVLGYMGSTGARSNGVIHLHFNIHHSSLPWENDVDPFDAVGSLAATSCLPVGPTTPAYRAEVVAQSFPVASAPFVLAPGGEVAGYVEVRNTGSATWNPGEVNLGTSNPRDASSELAAGDWISPGRAATIDHVVAPGETGRFVFTVHAPTLPGDYPQYFNLVRELVTWFSDSGGPSDAFIQVRVTVALPSVVDGDADGFSSTSDCDDANAAIHPGATDACGDGVDQDCSGLDSVCAADAGAMAGSDAGVAMGQDAGSHLGADASIRTDASRPTGVSAGCSIGHGRAPQPAAILALAVLARLARRRRAR